MSFIIQALLYNVSFDNLWKVLSVIWILAEVVAKNAAVAIYRHPIAALSIVVGTIVWRWLSRPLNRVRDMTDVGFGYLKFTARSRRRRLSSVVKETCEKRDPGDIPPVYPNGWFALLESRDLEKAQTKPVSALGNEFALFRGENGQAFVLDAFCPHLGAHLAVGGRVFDNCLECPFHGWQFRGEDGTCTHIPYHSKVPDVARIKTWPSCEKNGFIYVWYHAEGDPPSWQIPDIHEVNSGEWQYKGRTEHIVRCHIQELPENGADVAHLNQIHKAAVFSGNDLRLTLESKFWEFFRHEWLPSWEPNPAPHEHIATMSLSTTSKVFGAHLPILAMNLNIKQIGPSVVHLYFQNAFGGGVFVQGITPEGPLQQRFIHQMYTTPRYPQIIANIILFCEATMVERDVTVWNNKSYKRNPILVTEDKFISRFRRWYSQFYSKNSPTLASVRSSSLEW